LGILLLANQRGVIPLQKPLIEKMQVTNFGVSAALVSSLLNAAGE
jgi:predicted nucleic acid-binding protein